MGFSIARPSRLSSPARDDALRYGGAMYRPLAPCPACQRHVLATESSCPFCAAAIASGALSVRTMPEGTGRLSRAAAVALGFSLAAAACSETTTDARRQPAVGGGGASPAESTSVKVISRPEASSVTVIQPYADTSGGGQKAPTPQPGEPPPPPRGGLPSGSAPPAVPMAMYGMPMPPAPGSAPKPPPPKP